MKSLAFELLDNSAMTKQMRTSEFTSRTENSIADDVKLSNNSYISMFTNESTRISDPLVHSQVHNVVMIEAKRLVMNEKINTLRWKREQELLEVELKKFENKLRNSRPKFDKSSQIKKQSFSPLINNEKYTSIHEKINSSKIKSSGCDNLYFEEAICNDKEKLMTLECNAPLKEHGETLSNSGRIIVVIKDKPVIPLMEENLKIMRWGFDALKIHMIEAKRLQELKVKIQQQMMKGKLRRFFNAWRNKAKHSREIAAKNREECELEDVKKIESFVNMIKEKQKILGENQKNNKAKSQSELAKVNVLSEVMAEKNKHPRKNFINMTEPLNNRLKVQKKIIAEQKIKLAKQNRLIEEMKLKQIEVESKISGLEIMNIAKTIFNNCESKSRRTLIAQIIRQNNYEKKIDSKILNSSPATFPERLEARAIVRRQKMQQRQIEHERKLYEEKLKEEAMKIEEEKIRKQLQRDAAREIKIARVEQEKKRAENIEKIRIQNELADNFYRKYLLHNYIIRPLILLVQISHKKMIKAKEHCNARRLKNVFIAWKNDAKEHLKIKVELSIRTYNKNLQRYYFQQWREITKNEIRKYQVACDFYDLYLQEKYFKILMTGMVEWKIKNIENDKKAIIFCGKIMKKKYFMQWKKFMGISDDVKESDKRRDQWRQLIQTVIPDFAPKYRGVLIDD